MKNWIEFTTLKKHKYCYKTNKFIKLDKPLHVSICGSFANITLDGRYNLDTLISLSMDYMNNNKLSNYSGFIIHSAEWLKYNKVYQYIKNN